MEITTRTTPRQARSAKSVDLILDAAEQVFHQRGISETSTVDIALAARVSVGRLYYWFPDKDAVIDAMITRSQTRATDILAGMVDTEDLSVYQLLERISTQLGDFFLMHPGTLGVLQRREYIEASPAAASLREGFVRIVATIVSARVPDVPPAEAQLVGATCLRTGIAFYVDYVRAPEAQRPLILQDLQYLLAAYFNSRYPTSTDERWSDLSHPIRPARPRTDSSASSMVLPAMIQPA
jgi:AcrR family transcriptional regulator